MECLLCDKQLEENEVVYDVTGNEYCKKCLGEFQSNVEGTFQYNNEQIASELLKNSGKFYKEVIENYLDHLQEIEQGHCKDIELLRLHDCISYIRSVGFEIKGWMLWQIPTFYSHVFRNAKKNEWFDLAVWDIGEVIPRYLCERANEQDAKTIQEAIERYCVPD